MFDGEVWQYGMVLLAIVILFSIKAYVVRKQYSKNLEQYAHPEIFVEEVKKKVKSGEECESIIGITISGELTGDRLRNVSILVALMN